MLALACASACREPTEIRLEITTDIQDCTSIETAIAAGSPADVATRDPSAGKKSCDSSTGRIGSIVLVPSDGDGDEVGVRVVTALGEMTPQSCAEANYMDDDCIVQRRRLSFVPHTPLTLPVAMDQACRNKPCTDESTCRKGECVSSQVPRPANCPLPGGCEPEEIVWPSFSLGLGGNHTCSVTQAQNVRCWGDNASGELGYGDTSDRGDQPGEMPPADVDVGGLVVQLAVGGHSNCALLKDGTVRCWGRNDVGQLGYGDTTPRGVQALDMPPPAVEIGGAVAQLAAGASHFCAVLGSGKVRCWGYNGDGQLGYGDTNDRGDEPGEMPPPDVEVGGPVVRLAAGGAHTCALLANGRVRCWGANPVGQLGYGDTNNRGDQVGEMPPPDVDVGDAAVVLAAGYGHTCALHTNGRVTCWGSNEVGQLGGGGNANNRGDQPGEMPPPLVDLGGTASSLAADSRHTCVVAGGTVRCWGANEFGQLGYGDTNNRGDQPGEMPPPGVELDGLAVQVAIGDRHTCALMAENTVRCWGLGFTGQLGYGDTNNRGDEPGEMPSPDVPIGAPVQPLP